MSSSGVGESGFPRFRASFSWLSPRAFFSLRFDFPLSMEFFSPPPGYPGSGFFCFVAFSPLPAKGPWSKGALSLQGFPEGGAGFRDNFLMLLVFFCHVFSFLRPFFFLGWALPRHQPLFYDRRFLSRRPFFKWGLSCARAPLFFCSLYACECMALAEPLFSGVFFPTLFCVFPVSPFPSNHRPSHSLGSLVGTHDFFWPRFCE